MNGMGGVSLDLPKAGEGAGETGFDGGELAEGGLELGGGEGLQGHDMLAKLREGGDAVATGGGDGVFEIAVVLPDGHGGQEMSPAG